MPLTSMMMSQNGDRLSAIGTQPGLLPAPRQAVMLERVSAALLPQGASDVSKCIVPTPASRPALCQVLTLLPTLMYIVSIVARYGLRL